MRERSNDNRETPKQRLPEDKAIRRESEGREGRRGITLLGSEAIKKGEREPTDDDFSWC